MTALSMEKPKRKPGTLKRIAEEAGLSVSAVSRILNNSPNDFSSAQTREKVHDIAIRLGYRQKFTDKLLRGEPTHTAAILVSQPRMLSEEHYMLLINELVRNGNLRGYSVYWHNMTSDGDENIRIIESLSGRGVEHFILIGSPCGPEQVLDTIARLNRIWVGYGPDMLRRYVESDVRYGLKQLFRSLSDRGFDNFKLVCPPKQENRLQALFEYFNPVPRDEILKRYWYPLPHLDWVDGDFSRLSAESGYTVTAEVMKQFPDTRALVYLSDYYALGGVQYFFNNGYRIGKDVVVGGVNNIHAVREHIVPIDSVEHNISEIAKLIIDNLDSNKPLAVTVPTRLVIRSNPT